MTTPVDSRIVQRYVLGPVKSWVEEAAYLLGSEYGIRTVGGYRTTSTVPNSDHPKGLALDFMTSSKTQGDALAADAIANAQALGVKYVIWWRQIWTPERGWHTYTESNPHTDHVHVSFLDRAGSGSYVKAGKPATDLSANTCAWKIVTPSADLPDFLPGVPNELGAKACLIAKRQLRQIIGGLLLIAGGVTVATGLILLVAYGLQTQAGATASEIASVLTKVLPRGKG